jgi:hypothetical protein
MGYKEISWEDVENFSILTITRGRYNRPGVAAVPSRPSMDSTPQYPQINILGVHKVRNFCISNCESGITIFRVSYCKSG